MEGVKGPDNIRDQWFTELVEEYQDILLRTCCVILKDHALAEDAVQDTFLKVYQASDTFRKECSEKTWLMKIAMNTCRDIKRRAWFRWNDRRVTPDQLPEAFAVLEFKDDELMQSILSLPYKAREVLLLYYYQDMTLQEIGQSLNLAVSTVHTRLAQAKKKLRAAMEGGDERARS